jgi:TetR/AcrR family transcriptional regulator, regulator of cefoperazone and chloramphenicol sensitivity
MPLVTDALDQRPPDPRVVETRQRIVDTSLRLFAEHGFKGVSVRDISAAAGVNIASIGYHFGSKQGLYHTIFEVVLDQDEALFTEQMASVDRLLGRAGGDRALLVAAVEGLVAGMVGRIASYEYAHWFSVLLARELALPGVLFDLIYQRRAEPLLRMMTRLIAAALGLVADDPSARLSANVLHGQVCNLVFARPVLWRQMGWEGYSPERVELLVGTITDLICHSIGLTATPSQASVLKEMPQ